MSQYSPSQLVFSDESAYDRRTLSRRYCWNFRGRCACKYTFFIREKRYTIEGALCLNGLLAYAIQEGPMNSNDYNYFIEHILVIFTIMFINVLFIYYIIKNIFFFLLKLPKMNAFPGPYSVLVLDNVSIHKGQYLLDICNAKGVQVEFLPSYSPDLNL